MACRLPSKQQHQTPFKSLFLDTILFKSLSRTVTCTRELIGIYMCYSEGEELNTSLSRLSYLVLYTVVQLLPGSLFVPCLSTVLSTLCTGRSR